jgi:YHS domain-containing protein
MLTLSQRVAVFRLVLLVAATSFAAILPSLASEKLPLAIKGYDPVAYFTLDKAVLGKPDIEYEWDEQRYRFASAEHRELFKVEPLRYAPQFTNFCTMALARGELHEANPEYWLVSDGKLYLFGGPSGWEGFRHDPDGNIPKAHDNRDLVRKR